LKSGEEITNREKKEKKNDSNGKLGQSRKKKGDDTLKRTRSSL